MTAKELIEQLSKVAPETEIIGGIWNGKVDTYTVIDELHVIPYDDLLSDFYGTPGAFDDKLLQIRSKEVVYLGSMFETLDKRKAPRSTSTSAIPTSRLKRSGRKPPKC